MIDLHHGDCLDVMPTLEAGSIDLTVTSPPYDNLRTYNGSLDWGEHVWKPVLENLYRLTKEGGVVVWIVGDATIKGSETGTSFRQALYAMECGFRLHDTMVWEKKDPIPQVKQKRYWNCFEYMFIFTKGRPEIFNPIQVASKTGGKSRKEPLKQITTGEKLRVRKEWVASKTRVKKNIWSIATSSVKIAHTAIFPESLARDHIISWSNEGDTVFDPFLGSGTTGKMAIEQGRKFIGIEKDAEYFEIAKKRIESAERKETTQ